MNEKRITSKFLVEVSNKLHIEPLSVICLNSRVVDVYENHDLDRTGRVIVPAFFNMHSHLGESIFKDIEGYDWSVAKYLEYTEKYHAELTKEEKDCSWLQSARYSAKEMYFQGTLGFCAARSSYIAREYEMLYMSGYPIMNSCKLTDYKKEGVRGFNSYKNTNKSETGKIGVFLHSVYLNDIASFELARKCMNIGAEFITVHVSEDKFTTGLEKQAYNISAISLLDNYGLLSEKTILVHCGWCSDKDLQLIKERGAVICVCPISNMFLNTKMANLYKLEEMGIPWCVATDGLGTGRTFSLLDQIRYARREYPDISLEKYWSSITSVPGVFFRNILYTGKIEINTSSVFLVTDYIGNDVNELIEGLTERTIRFRPIRV